MIYMNGKSNLEPFALRDMNRLETVGSTEKVNIVVELGRSKGLENDTAAEGDWSGVRRYLVARDADMEKINSPVLRDIGASDMGDWREAAKFVRWAREAYPAKRFMLILWDHGWGWLDPLKPDYAPHHHRLAAALEAAGKKEEARPHWETVLHLPVHDPEDRRARTAARKALRR